MGKALEAARLDRITAERDAQNLANQLVAAEARVKDLEGQLENWQRATERYYDVTTEYFSDMAFDADGTLADADGTLYVLLDELRRARTALKGGSNG